MSAINVNSITGRTGTHGPVLTGVTTATNGLNVTGGSVGIGTSVPYYELHVQGGIGATSLWVAGVSTFTSDVSVTGVTTLASAGGITTTGGDLYVGGDLFVLDDVVYDEVTGRNLNITGVGTITRLNTTSLVGTSGTITTLNSTTGTITQLTNTDFVSTSSTITSIVGTSATITRISNTDIVGTGATITTGAIVQLTNTDLVSTSSTITSIVGYKCYYYKVKHNRYCKHKFYYHHRNCY